MAASDPKLPQIVIRVKRNEAERFHERPLGSLLRNEPSYAEVRGKR
jgi:hypothetical protein